MIITIHIHLHILQIMATLLSTLLILLGHTLIIVLHLIRAMEVILEDILHTHHHTTIMVTMDKGGHQEDHLHQETGDASQHVKYRGASDGNQWKFVENP